MQAVASRVQMSTEEEEAVRKVWQQSRTAAQGTALSRLQTFQGGVMDHILGSDEEQVKFSEQLEVVLKRWIAACNSFGMHPT